MDMSDNVLLEQEISGCCSFHNTYSRTLDDKKRLTIPSAWRAMVGTPKCLHILPDFHRPCLRVVPGAEWARRLDRIRQLSMSNQKAREFVHELGRQSDVVGWDSQGRIRVNDALLDFAGLRDQVTMVGAIDTFELWAPESLTGVPVIDQAKLREAAEQFEF